MHGLLCSEGELTSRCRAHARRIAGIVLLPFLWQPFAAVCQAVTAKIPQPHATLLPSSAPPRSSDTEEQSCKAFVQGFYDWYWNRFAARADDLNFDLRKLPNVETVLRRKPAVLSPELHRLLANEEKQMKITHEIGNLDFDPFWGNQDAQGKYLVDQITVADGQCRARVKQGNQGNEFVELKKAGSAWVFANIYYCFSPKAGGKNCPDSNLIEILKP